MLNREQIEEWNGTPAVPEYKELKDRKIPCMIDQIKDSIFPGQPIVTHIYCPCPKCSPWC